MDTIKGLVDQGKDLVGQYLNTDSSSSGPNPSSETGAVPDAAESLGVNQLGTDTGDATFSGDLERESGSGLSDQGFSPAYAAYNASGRDSTGSFNGGANEDVENVGAGELPGRS
ncbi:hypothetical protein JCM6882_003491 [Rhodosporidiobolus microsporus]